MNMLRKSFNVGLSSRSIIWEQIRKANFILEHNVVRTNAQHAISTGKNLQTLRYLSSSSSTLENSWLITSERLDKAKIGSLSPQDMHQGTRLIQSISQLHTKEGTSLAWHLLDRLLLEEQLLIDETTRIAYTTSLIGTLVNTWVVARNDFSPRDVFLRVIDCENKIPHLWADVVTYNMILDTATKEGAPDAHILAHEIIDHLMKGDGPARVTTILFNTAMNAIAKSNTADAPYRGAQLLQNMRDMTSQGVPDVAPDSITYGTLISTWTNSGFPDAAKRAEELLMQSPKPQSSTFNAVMNAWAKAGGQEQDTIEKCIHVFMVMKEQYKLGQSDARPNAVSYGTIMGVLAKQGRAKEAEKYLVELIMEYDKSSNPDLAPTRVHFNALIDAWSRTRDRDISRRVQEIVRKMQQIAADTGNKDLEPDVVTYTSVLQAILMSRDGDVVPRAEAILKEMWDRYHAGNTAVKPNTRTCNKVLDCWLHSRAGDTSLKAEQLLRTMQKHSGAGDNRLQPDTTTYALILDIWSKSRKPDAPERVESLIDEIELLSRDQGVPVYLNKIMINMAIITWSRSGRQESLERAEALFKRLHRLAEAGWDGMQPNTGVYNAILSVLAKSRDQAAFEKANSYLIQLKQRYQSGDVACKPNTITYSTLLDVLSSSRNKDTYTTITAILEEMTAMQCIPDQITLNCMIKCIARDDREDKADVAWNLVNMMEERYSLSPSTRTLNEVLAACARSDRCDREIRDTAFQIAILSFRRILKENNPDSFSFRLFFTAAVGLQQFKEVEKVWNQCCHYGFQNDPAIVRTVRIAAPHLLTSSNTGTRMSKNVHQIQ